MTVLIIAVIRISIIVPRIISMITALLSNVIVALKELLSLN